MSALCDILREDKYSSLHLDSKVEDVKSFLGKSTSSGDIEYNGIKFEYVYYNRSNYALKNGVLSKIELILDSLPEKLESTFSLYCGMDITAVISQLRLCKVKFKVMKESYSGLMIISSLSEICKMLFDDAQSLQVVLFEKPIAFYETVEVYDE